MIYIFDIFELDTELFELRRNGEALSLEPKSFDLLHYLIRNRHRLVTKDEIIEAIWDGRIVSEATIGSCVNSARRAVGDTGRDQKCIKTLARRGFRFVADVETVSDSSPEQNADNFQDLQEISAVSALKYSGSVANEASNRASLAILPFDNFSADPDQEFIADGIVEDVTTELSRFRWLFVIARNSTFAYKSTPKDVRMIAEELGVRYIVEGSVRRAGERLRVNAQLIDASTGEHIWANRWDRLMVDLFDIQDELTTAIVGGLEPELGAHERHLARQKPTEELTAWELCHRGLSEFLTFSEDGFSKAEQLYSAAIDEDPDFSLPYALSARLCYLRVLSARATAPDAEVQKGLDLANTALRLDDRSDLAHQMLGGLYSLVRRHDEAFAMLNRGLALNPNNASMYNYRAICSLLGPSPDPEAIVKDTETGLELSPMDPTAAYMYNVMGLAYLVDDFKDSQKRALSAFEQACSYQNADWYCHFLAALLLARDNQRDAARQHVHEAIRLRPSLTLETMAGLWSYPMWFELWAKLKDEADELLVPLGIPST